MERDAFNEWYDLNTIGEGNLKKGKNKLYWSGNEKTKMFQEMKTNKCMMLYETKL